MGGGPAGGERDRGPHCAAVRRPAALGADRGAGGHEAPVDLVDAAEAGPGRRRVFTR